ncbi:Xaa-Pro peptidase family protein [Mariniblastus sp.]|nr:Xaa-Pro peptidase family protein [Mariniblastus sp.]
MNRYQDRRRKLVACLADTGADGILISNLKNIRYLTGFTGSAAYLFLSPQQQILASDARYSIQLEQECPGLEIDIRDVASTLIDSAVRLVKSFGWKSLAVESARIYKADFDELESRMTDVQLIGTTQMVERLRMIKDDSEIAAIRKSIQVNQTAFQNAVAAATPKQTEREFSFVLEAEMRKLGARRFAFDPIIGVGPRAALPHGSPTDVKLGSASNFLVDWGANVDGYLSDLCRMVITSDPEPKFVEIYDTVLRAQATAIAQIQPGIEARTVDAATRSVIEEAGFGEFFQHGSGHSFGLEIHEKPFLSPSSDAILTAGMVLTVEPGIYLPGIAGVRIEDDVLVTDSGCEVLSNLPKDLEQCVARLGG